MTIFRVAMRSCLAACLFGALQTGAEAQGMFTASVGSVFGGDVPSQRNTWAVSIGGGGAHGIGSELEFSQTRNFFETADGVAYGTLMTLMPGISVTVPVGSFRPYGMVGFGLIRQQQDGSGGDTVTNDTGYSVGGGVTYQFSRKAGIRGDLRHLKVNGDAGISFQRFLIGIVLGG